MAGGIELKIKGLKEAREHLDRYEGKKLNARMKKGVMSGARLMATAVRGEASRKTGMLAKSVRARSARGGGVLRFGGIAVRSVQHPGARANPFVDRGIEKSVDKGIEQIVKAITAVR